MRRPERHTRPGSSLIASAPDGSLRSSAEATAAAPRYGGGRSTPPSPVTCQGATTTAATRERHGSPDAPTSSDSGTTRCTTWFRHIGSSRARTATASRAHRRRGPGPAPGGRPFGRPPSAPGPAGAARARPSMPRPPAAAIPAATTVRCGRRASRPSCAGSRRVCAPGWRRCGSDGLAVDVAHAPGNGDHDDERRGGGPQRRPRGATGRRRRHQGGHEDGRQHEQALHPRTPPRPAPRRGGRPVAGRRR